MIINHNIMSMNAQRAQGVNAGGLGKSIEKLSTGQRVNRAADDAAGLYISEKMRTQVRGLTQASRNSQDGISAVQTAEGALDEVHSMLQRMRELTVQAGNDTNQAEDRKAIDAEMDQLADEIQSISAKTEFNKQKLLDGNFTGKKLQVGANQNQILEIDIKSMSAEKLGLGKFPTDDKKAKWTSKEDFTEIPNKVKLGSDDQPFVMELSLGEKKLQVSMTTGAKKADDGTYTAAGGGQGADGTAINLATAVQKINNAINADGELKGKYTAKADGNKLSIEATNATSEDAISVSTIDGTAEFNAVGLRGSGDNAADATKTNIGEQKGIFISTLDVSDSTKVQETLGKIDKAIAAVSKQRSDLGAIQNRLEHTIKNLDNAAENTQAAESRIRDTNMAKEMSEFTKNNVLSQAAQSMISQANQLPQQALQLLR